MLNCSFVAVIRSTLFYRGIGQTPCSYEHYLGFKDNRIFYVNKQPPFIVLEIWRSFFWTRWPT